MSRLMMNSGVSFMGATRDQLIDTQAELCKIQLNLENSFFNIARKKNENAVILSDRGCMDGKAYLPDDMWKEMLKRNKWTNKMLREGRYDGICHLVSTAMGAEKLAKHCGSTPEHPGKFPVFEMKL